MGCGRSSSKRGVYSSPGTPQGTTVSDHHHLNRNKRQRPQSADRGKHKNQSRDRQTETTDQAVKDKTAKPAGQGGQQQRGPREDMQGGRLWSETLEGLQTVAPILQTDRREDLEETGAFLEICNSQEWTGRNRRSDRPVTSSETKLVVKTSSKQKSGTRELHEGTLPDTQTDNTYPSQTTPKNRTGGNTLQFLLWCHNYLDTKIRQTLQEKKTITGQYLWWT